MPNSVNNPSQGDMGRLFNFPLKSGSAGIYSTNTLERQAGKGEAGDQSVRGGFSETTEGSKLNPRELNKDEDENEFMSLSREELDARLSQNKAEVDAIASEMRREMAEFRSFQAQQFTIMQSSFSELKSQISGVNGEITGLKGQIDGLKTTTSSMQWMVGSILAVLALILAFPQVQTYLKPEPKEPTINVQPHVAPPQAIKPSEKESPKSENPSNN